MQGTNVPASRLQVNVEPARGLSLWAALAWQKAVISVPPPASPQFAGHEIDHTPHWLWSGGIDYRPSETLTFTLTGRGQSSYFLSSANSEGKWGRMTVFDASAFFQLGERVELGLALKNSGDDFY